MLPFSLQYCPVIRPAAIDQDVLSSGNKQSRQCSEVATSADRCKKFVKLSQCQ